MSRESRYAPIILFAYNRPRHVLRTLEALGRNEESSQSPLFVFIDGPAKEEHKTSVSQVRAIVEEFKWKGPVSIHFSKENKGLKNSVIDGCTSVFESYDRAIILEDDILVSPGFLDFMNKGLDSYKENPDVFGISGFRYANPIAQNRPFFLPLGSSWGWATWKSRWKKVWFNAPELAAKIAQKGLVQDFDFGKYPYFEMLISQVEKGGNSWAILFYASMFLEKGIFLFPQDSLVQNIGFDGTGTNEVGGYDITTPNVVQYVEFSKVMPVVIPSIENSFKHCFQESLKVSFGAEVKMFFRIVKARLLQQ